MKKFILIIFVIVCKTAFAQPTVLFTGLTTTTPAPNNSRYPLDDKGIFKQFRFQANQSASASTLGWSFHSGTTASPDYSKSWRPFSNGNTLSFNDFIPTTFANGARYNTGGGGSDGLLPTITNGNYYTFNVDYTLAANSSYAMSLLETSYNPTALTSHVLIPPASTNGAAKVTVTAAAPLNPGEYVYMRYSTNNFTTAAASFFIEIPFVGNTSNFFMPCFTANTITYYFFSSNKTFAQINSDYASNSNNESVYDMATLNMLTSGYLSNFTYTQPGTISTNFSGNYSIPSACYPTLNSFITGLNTGNVVGPVTVNVASTYSEMAPSGGFSITKTGTSTNTITFKKDGTDVGPIFTGSNVHTISKITDAVFKIIGADYITLDGLTMLENGSNTTTPSGTNNMTEYGVALFYATTTDGAQNNTIKNCTIDLNRVYTNTFGIFSNSSVGAGDAGVSAPATAGNNNLTITSNIIKDVNQGIVIVGSGSAASAHNDGLIIGGTASDGNSITDFGTGSQSSGFNLVSASINGIIIRNTKNFNVSFNTITSSTAPNISTVRGVFVDSFSQAPTGTLAHTISNNNISLANGTSGNGIEGISNNNTTGNVTTTININNNDFNNFTANNGNNGVTFIKNYQSGIAININNNTFTDLAINNIVNTNYFIDMGSTSLTSTGIQNVNGNKIIGAFTKNGASGSLGIYNSTGSSPTGAVINNNNNEFSNITLSGTTLIEGWRSADGVSGNGPTKNVNFNKFENWSGGTGIKIVMSVAGHGATSSISNNTINNINTIISGSGNMTGINLTTAGAATQLDIKSNTITNFNGGIGAIIGIKSDCKATNVNIETNQIKNFLSAGSVSAIESVNGTPILVTMSTNDIDNLKTSATGGLKVNGVLNSGNTVVKIENNSIKNLECTSTTNTDYIRGINITNSAVVATLPLINNNVIDGLIAASTSNSSSIAGIFLGASANYVVTNNTVKNISTNTTNINTSSSIPVVGILTISSGTTQVINKNTVFNVFANNNSAVNVNVVGILTAASAAAGSQLYTNTIYGLKNLATGTAPTLSGIYNSGGGVWTVANNMVSLDNGGVTNPMQIYGINDLGLNGSRNYYFNSIDISGSTATGSLNSFGFQFTKIGPAATFTINIKNNIFNIRRIGSGKNICVGDLAGNNLNGMFFNTNIYNVFNPNTLALTAGSNNISFGNWKLYSGDINATTDVPITFTNTSIADLHILNNCSSSIANGLAGLPITVDFDNTTRNTIPDIGADEYSATKYVWSGSWSPAGTPTITTPVTFNSSYDMTSLSSIDACSVTINGASTVVTIVDTKYLNIQNDLTVNTGAKLIVQNQANLVQVNDAASVINNGFMEVNKTTTPYEKYDYTYWSSPLFSATIGTPFAAWRLDYSFFFKTQNFQDLFSGLGYPQTTGSPDFFDDNGDDWQPINAGTTMARGTGYALMTPTNVSFATAPTASVVFSGKVNNGLIPVTIEQSANTASTFDDYNLVGNPYPSAISADSFIKANILPLATSNKISGTLYFWTHKGDLQPVLTNPGPYVNNFNSNDYALYNLTGPAATGSGTVSGSGGAAPLGNIASCQGFFVESQSPIPTDIIFNNSMRNKTFNNNQFYRNAVSNAVNTTNTTVVKDRLWLNYENADHMFSQQLIGYLPDTTLDFDYGYDGMQNSSPNFVKFYSFMANDINFYKIQSRGGFNIDDQLILGYSSAVSGATTITLEAAEGVLNDPQTNVFLQDNLLNITHDLKQSPYAFTTDYGTFNDRFVLKYQNALLANNNFVNNENLIKIWTKDSNIHLNAISENIKSIVVYDVLGRLLFSKEAINTKQFIVDNLKANNQTLIIKIKLVNDEVVTEKIIIK